MPRTLPSRRSGPAGSRVPRFSRNLVAAGLLLLGGAARAGDPGSGAPPSAPAVAAPQFSESDRARWRALREANDRIGRLAARALRFTPTPDVLILAHQLRDDHARMAGEIDRMTPDPRSATGGRPPPLEGSVSEEFDRQFLAGVAEESEQALELCAEIVRAAEAPVLRAFATDAVVTLDRNLQRVRELQKPQTSSTK
ncbi:MAG TPA: DUF4142 domain-containing protein [Opitutaceae bacterium]|nr:DUF4142 domain-containing protein [Opitutaceae bacterium]